MASSIPLIDEHGYAAFMDGTVLPALDHCRQEGWMPAAGDRGLGIPPATGRLHYVCFDAARFDELDVSGASARFRGAVVISHGFTEFIEKYAELIWYLLMDGYSVCMPEHRGHGYSARDVDDPSLVWIDDWRRYVADLVRFSQDVGQRYADSRPLNLFSHSMGGGIGAAVIERYPTLFDKAVLSSPMIVPSAGMPIWLARAAVSAADVLGFGKSRIAGQGEFSPVFDMEGNEGASEERLRWYHARRCADVHFQTYAPTYGWMRQMLAMSRAVLRQKACDGIETPTLLLQAGRDVWVRNDAENRFARQVRLGGGDIRMERFADSVHMIFSMPNTVMRTYVDDVLTFLDTPSVQIIGSDEWSEVSRR